MGYTCAGASPRSEGRLTNRKARQVGARPSSRLRGSSRMSPDRRSCSTTFASHASTSHRWPLSPRTRPTHVGTCSCSRTGTCSCTCLGECTCAYAQVYARVLAQLNAHAHALHALSMQHAESCQSCLQLGGLSGSRRHWPGESSGIAMSVNHVNTWYIACAEIWLRDNMQHAAPVTGLLSAQHRADLLPARAQLDTCCQRRTEVGKQSTVHVFGGQPAHVNMKGMMITPM